MSSKQQGLPCSSSSSPLSHEVNRQLRHSLLVQSSESSHAFLDVSTSSSPDTTTASTYTLKDITYSILESTLLTPSTSPPSLHDHDGSQTNDPSNWNTDEAIQAIQQGIREIPLKKYQEVSLSLCLSVSPILILFSSLP
jgi:hypothetical protein